MNKNRLLSVLCAIAFSAVSFSAVAADHAAPPRSDDATTNAESNKARPGMAKPPKKHKKHKKAKKAKKAAPAAEQKEAPAAK